MSKQTASVLRSHATKEQGQHAVRKAHVSIGPRSYFVRSRNGDGVCQGSPGRHAGEGQRGRPGPDVVPWWRSSCLAAFWISVASASCRSQYSIKQDTENGACLLAVPAALATGRGACDHQLPFAAFNPPCLTAEGSGGRRSTRELLLTSTEAIAFAETILSKQSTTARWTERCGISKSPGQPSNIVAIEGINTVKE